MKPHNIVSLILSLSPIEKQYFKKSNNSDSDFIQLFDYINKYKNFDREKIKTYLNKKKKGKSKSNKNYTSGHISVIKNYLHEKVMESLRSQYIPQRPSYEMMIRSLNADILLEKGLYHLAKNEINVVKKKFQDSAFPIEKLIFFRRESFIQFHEDYANNTFEEIMELFNARLSTAEQLLLEIKFAKDVGVLSHQYFKGNNDSTIVQQILDKDYMKDPSLSKEFATKYLFFWVHAQCAEFQNQSKKAIQFFEKAILIWLENPKYISTNPRIYLTTCFTYIKYILQQGKSHQIILKKNDIKLLLSKLSKLHLQGDLAKRWELLFEISQLLEFRKNYQYLEIIHRSPAILNSFEDAAFTTDFIRILVNFLYALSYFQQGDYKKSNLIVSALIQEEKVSLRANPEYFNHAWMLYLLGLFELKDFKYLKFELKRAKQVLKENDQFHSFEDYFLKMLGQLISPRYYDKHESVLNRYFKKLKLTEAEYNLGNHYEYQVILDWIANKS